MEWWGKRLVRVWRWWSSNFDMIRKTNRHFWATSEGRLGMRPQHRLQRPQMHCMWEMKTERQSRARNSRLWPQLSVRFGLESDSGWFSSNLGVKQDSPVNWVWVSCFRSTIGRSWWANNPKTENCACENRAGIPVKDITERGPCNKSCYENHNFKVVSR